ncbi:MAG: HAMP domain-containing sensor histidine kinase [Actinomycetota bacterium]|nr:HAMP domain-containing sensor histidine kinase [Actinomycetota bacterium]MDA3020627.1 HAMP domain-containing sensor histidine kinase [Actinomycetota bacterium]
MSLRWKLMLLLVVIVGGVTTSVGIISYQSTEDRMMTEIDNSLGTATNVLLNRRDSNRPGRQDNGGMIVIPDRPLGIEQYVVQLTDRNGNILAATVGIALPPMQMSVDNRGIERPEIATLTGADGIQYRVRAEGFSVGIVQLGRDLSEVENVLTDLRSRTVLTGVIVALLSAILGWVIAASMTSRLRKLSIAAEHVAATGKFDVDTPSSGRDETARLARSFKEMLEALSRSKEQQKRLVQDAGHELRTPLTSMRTNLDVMRRHPNMDQAMREQIMIDLERDAGDMAALVEEVVAIAAERHSNELPEPIEMKSVTQSIVERASRRSGRDIVVNGDDSIVIANHHMFDRAVSNLIDNALKFDTSSQQIEVMIHNGSLTVSDRGIGIPEDEVRLIFERFHRSAASRSMPGSGLGLSIVADFAQAHGGSVFARNRAGGGAEIGFSLPPENK